MRNYILSLMLMLGLTPALAFAQTITVNQATTYQTMRGWEAQNEGGEQRSDFDALQPAMFDKVVEAGINRIRMEIR